MVDSHVGLPSAPGKATGPAQVVQRERPRVPRRRVSDDARQAEVARFDEAVQATLVQLDATERGLEEAEDSEHITLALSLVISHRAVLNDPLLIKGVHAKISAQGLCAEWALERVLGELKSAFGRLNNADLNDWWQDVETQTTALMRRLIDDAGEHRLETRSGAVLVAHSLGVGEMIALIRTGAVAVVLEEGSLTSHVAILCRSAGLPAVVGLTEACALFDDGALLEVNGDAGQVRELHNLVPKQPNRRSFESLATPALNLRPPLLTQDGIPITLRANLDLRLDAKYARQFGTHGVGLLRTVYQYTGRQQMPKLQELTTIFREVLSDFAPAPVTIRLLDLGGPIEDQTLPLALRGLSQHRGIRLWHHRPEAIDLQLQALSEASDAGNLRILVPFVTDAAEITQVRKRIQTLMGRDRAASVQIGAMIEVPAAVMMADEIAAVCDFMAIGTNDLCQFLYAVSRDAPAHRARALPRAALLRAIKQITEAGQAHKIDVCLCGEWASQPDAIPLLLGAGLREFSLSPRLAPAIIKAVQTCSVVK